MSFKNNIMNFEHDIIEVELPDTSDYVPVLERAKEVLREMDNDNEEVIKSISEVVGWIENIDQKEHDMQDSIQKLRE